MSDRRRDLLPLQSATCAGPEPQRSIIHCSYNVADNSPFLPVQEAHAYRPLAVMPDNTILDGAWDTVFNNQVFIDGDGNSGYGYKVLRAGSRADSQPPRMGISTEL